MKLLELSGASPFGPPPGLNPELTKSRVYTTPGHSYAYNL